MEEEGQDGGAGDTAEREGYSTDVKERRRRIMLRKERWRSERTEKGGGRQGGGGGDITERKVKEK